MKRKTIIAFMTSTLLAGTAWTNAQNTDKPGERKTDVGNNTTEKIQQGLKNTFTELKLEDLPAAVQKTIREQSKGVAINDIDREDRTGRTIYEVEFETDGANREIHIAADGTLLTEEQASMQLGYDRDNRTDADRTRVRDKDNDNLKFSNLPASVQATVKQHGNENQIADIDSYWRNGKRVYEVEFRKEGLNHEIHVGEDGKLMDNSAVGAPGNNSGAVQGTDRSTTERTAPPSGNGTVPNYTPQPKDTK